jgi:hypothetical protein
MQTGVTVLSLTLHAVEFVCSWLEFICLIKHSLFNVSYCIELSIFHAQLMCI